MRVIGLPGETIDFSGEVILVDGVAPPMPAALSGLKLRSLPSIDESMRPTVSSVVLGPDSYFVVGDEPEHAYDSRFWGALERGQILGKMVRP